MAEITNASVTADTAESTVSIEELKQFPLARIFGWRNPLFSSLKTEAPFNGAGRPNNSTLPSRTKH